MTPKLRQPKEITIQIGKSTFVLDDLDRSYDAGAEFDVELSGDDISKVLQANPDIVCDMAQWGNDTEVGDRFYCALVFYITGESIDSVRKTYKGDSFYAHVKNVATKKGLTIYT
jgi:hypothetical protein